MYLAIPPQMHGISTNRNAEAVETILGCALFGMRTFCGSELLGLEHTTFSAHRQAKIRKTEELR
jgi:hypothetical protein